MFRMASKSAGCLPTRSNITKRACVCHIFDTHLSRYARGDNECAPPRHLFFSLYSICHMNHSDRFSQGVLVCHSVDKFIYSICLRSIILYVAI